MTGRALLRNHPDRYQPSQLRASLNLQIGKLTHGLALAICRYDVLLYDVPYKVRSRVFNLDRPRMGLAANLV